LHSQLLTFAPSHLHGQHIHKWIRATHVLSLGPFGLDQVLEEGAGWCEGVRSALLVYTMLKKRTLPDVLPGISLTEVTRCLKWLGRDMLGMMTRQVTMILAKVTHV
jgi:hypothetical protein